MPGPVPAGRRRRPEEHQVGHGRQPQPRRHRRRLRHPVLRRRLRRHDASPPTAPAPTRRRAGTVLQDFEYGVRGWTADRQRLRLRARHRPLPGQQTVTGYQGNGLVNSFNDGDGATGTLTSPAFTVDKRYLNFLVGGGNHPFARRRRRIGTRRRGLRRLRRRPPTATGWTATGDFAGLRAADRRGDAATIGPKVDTYVARRRPGTGHPHVTDLHRHKKYMTCSSPAAPTRRPADPTAVELSRRQGRRARDRQQLRRDGLEVQGRRELAGQDASQVVDETTAAAGDTSWWTTSCSPTPPASPR